MLIATDAFANIDKSIYICDTNTQLMNLHSCKILPIFLVAIVYGFSADAQRRIVAYTTAQSIARTETNYGSNFQHEVIEVYEYDNVDVQPTFPGGNTALIRFINSSRRYPTQAYQQRIQGRVLCSFVVQSDGSITHVNVLKSVEPSLDREAVRVISQMPQWQAGRMGHECVPVYCILPIAFRL